MFLIFYSPICPSNIQLSTYLYIIVYIHITYLSTHWLNYLPSYPPTSATHPFNYPHLSLTLLPQDCKAAVGALELDAVYKATLDAILPDGEPGVSLSFSLDAGALHVGEWQEPQGGSFEVHFDFRYIDHSKDEMKERKV